MHRNATTNRRGFGDAAPKRRRRRGVEVATTGKAVLKAVRLVVHRLVVGRGVVQRREHRRRLAIAARAATQQRRETIVTGIGGQVVLPPRRRRRGLQSRSRRSTHHTGTGAHVGSGGGRSHRMHRGHGIAVTRLGTAGRKATSAHQHLLQLVANGTVVGDVVDRHLVQGLHGAQGGLNALGSQRVVNEAVAVLDAHLGVHALLLQGHFDDLAEGREELQDHLLGDNRHELLRQVRNVHLCRAKCLRVRVAGARGHPDGRVGHGGGRHDGRDEARTVTKTKENGKNRDNDFNNRERRLTSAVFPR